MICKLLVRWSSCIFYSRGHFLTLWDWDNVTTNLTAIIVGGVIVSTTLQRSQLRSLYTTHLWTLLSKLVRPAFLNRNGFLLLLHHQSISIKFFITCNISQGILWYTNSIYMYIIHKKVIIISFFIKTIHLYIVVVSATWWGGASDS